jgi:Zn-dependent protease
VLVLILLLLLPMMLFHYWAQAIGPLPPLLFWLFLVFPLVLFFLLGRPEEEPQQALAEAQEAAEQGEQALTQQAALIAQLTSLAAADFAIQTTRYETGQIVFEGVVRGDAQHAYDALARKFARVERTPLLLEGEGGRTLLMAVPQTATAASGAAAARPMWNLLLFLATLVTTTWAGAMHQGVNLVQEPGRFAVGLPYALPLLAILGIHELGHYIMARYHGIKVTLPYFIPVPFGLGTFGAFIHLQSTPKERRSLFDMAVAGPLAGLVVAIPALFLGLQGSEAVPAPMAHGMNLGSSALLTWIYALATDGVPPLDHVIRFSPLAFAGWLGLLVTALNLIPVGQLDGGHIAYVLFGRRRAKMVASAAFFLLLVLGIFYWSGWLTWAIVIFFLTGFKHEPALNEVIELNVGRRLLGAFAFLLLVLIMAPIPYQFMQVLGLVCPYI